ncbi:hypothetical protein BTVI_96320 [Pitangus sulphuratus]|nr:hypothetical protein BTVI_96320 [Pitangus sulphuratus]
MAPPSPSTNSSNNSSNNSSGEQLSKTNLYIRGLPPGTTDQDLIKLCQPVKLKALIKTTIVKISKPEEQQVSLLLRLTLEEDEIEFTDKRFSRFPWAEGQMAQILCCETANSHLLGVGLGIGYGKIVSTKAILDKNTNQCKAVGSVLISGNASYENCYENSESIYSTYAVAHLMQIMATMTQDKGRKDEIERFGMLGCNYTPAREEQHKLGIANNVITTERNTSSRQLAERFEELKTPGFQFYSLPVLNCPDKLCSFMDVKCTGYGFVDFDSPAAAQKAVASLKANGVQAQMAKRIIVSQLELAYETLCKFRIQITDVLSK